MRFCPGKQYQLPSSRIFGRIFSLAISLIIIFPQFAFASTIVPLTPGEKTSGKYNASSVISYEFKLDQDALVSLHGYKDDMYSYYIALYSSLNRDDSPPGLDLKGLTQMNYSGILETRDIYDYELKVNESAMTDGEAFFPLSAGSYYLRIKPEGINEEPDFNFVLDVQPYIYAAETEPNNELAAASPYSAGNWQEGLIMRNGNQPDASALDWYSMSIPEAGNYNFSYVSDGFFKGKFVWYDENGKNVVLMQNPATTTASSTKTVLEMSEIPLNASIGEHQDSAAEKTAALEFAKPGKYYICIQGESSGSYKFRLSPVGSVGPPVDSPANPSDNLVADNGNVQPAITPASNTSSTGQDIDLIFMIGRTFYSSNGSVITMDSAPYAASERTFVPVRALANGIGIPDSGIMWNDVDQTVTLTDGITTLSLLMGSNVLYNNGNAVIMDVSPAASSGRVFLPARYIAEAFGLTAEWEPLTNSIIIRGNKSSSVPATVNSANSVAAPADQPVTGQIELDRQMINGELRKGTYSGSLLNGKPSGTGTWVDCLGRIKTGAFSMPSATEVEIRSAHIAFPDGAEFNGQYSAVLYSAAEVFEGHFSFPSNGNVFDGKVENSADLKQHMVGTYTLPSGKTVDVDRFYDL